MFAANAHRCDEKRFIVRANETQIAFMELEWLIRAAKRVPMAFVVKDAKGRSPFWHANSLTGA
jgi:hypothetical protein